MKCILAIGVRIYTVARHHDAEDAGPMVPSAACIYLGGTPKVACHQYQSRVQHLQARRHTIAHVEFDVESELGHTTLSVTAKPS